jgi:hypothetical protein
VDGVSEQLCVPHPEGDPIGYAAAIEPCDAQPSPSFDDCDGPEDCESDQFCVAREGSDGLRRCRDMPSTVDFCCFTCGAPVDCTICRSSQDCTDGENCSLVAAGGVMGCQ